MGATRVAKEPEAGEARELMAVPPIRAGWAAIVTATLAVVIVLAEVGRLTEQIVSPVDQRPHGVTSLVGPATLVSFDWQATAQAWVAGWGSAPAWSYLVIAHTLLDLALVAAWGGVWWVLLRRSSLVPFSVVRMALSFTSEAWSNAQRVVLIGLSAACLDLLEDLLILASAWAPAMSGIVAVVTMAKWIALIGFATASLVWFLKDAQASRVRASVRRWWQALVYQRLSMLVIAPLAMLALIPRGDISDQLPDIERAWADAPWGSPAGWSAVAATLVVAAGLFVLGRLRTDHVMRLVPEFGLRTPLSQATSSPPVGWLVENLPRLRRQRRAELPAIPEGAVERPRALLWTWFVWPTVLVVIAAAIAVGGFGAVAWARLGVFVSFATVIAIISAYLRRGRYRDVRHAPVPTSPDVATYRATAVTGDMLAISLLAVGGLGLVRSFTAPFFLAATSHLGGESSAPMSGVRPAVLLLCGAVGAVAVWPALRVFGPRLGAVVGNRFARRMITPGDNALLRRAVRLGFFGATVAILLAVVGVQQIAAAGVVVVALVGLSALALAVGALLVIGQDRHPPEIFWFPWLRQRSAPVVALTLLALLFSTTVGAGGPSAVHGVHAPASLTVPQRPTFAEALQRWSRAQPESCGATVTDGIRARPLLFVAAEGGGIRAAYWTTTALELLQGDVVARSGCRKDAFLSTGASGGAVGLTLAQFLPRGSAQRATTDIAASDALSRATQGLLIRDTFYAATGVGLQADPGWTDRAAAIEDAWIGATAHAGKAPLANGFLSDIPAATTTPTGLLVLGSTSVGTGCRVLLSQVHLDPPVDPLGRASSGRVGTTPVPCDGVQAPGARSYDLFSAYGSGDGACTGDLRAATVALLASRFPYVTPSGVVGPCGPWREDQIVDGGYEENTGLGAILDLAPAWMAAVRTHNDAVLMAGRGTLAIPMVVFLTNGNGSDLLPSDRQITQELFVPLVALVRGSASQNSPSALLQRTAALMSQKPWSVDGSAGSAAMAYVTTSRTFVVSPATRPSVAAPLGWTLSEASRTSLSQRAAEQLTKRCASPEVRRQVPASGLEVVDVLCARGYGTLGDASAFMDRLLIPK